MGLTGSIFDMENNPPTPTATRLAVLLAPAVLIPVCFALISNTGMAITMLLFVLPVVLVAIGAVAGYQRERWWLHALVVAATPAISALVLLDSSVLIYAAFYAVADLVGYLIGWLAVRTLNAREQSVANPADPGPAETRPGEGDPTVEDLRRP